MSQGAWPLLNTSVSQWSGAVARAPQEWRRVVFGDLLRERVERNLPNLPLLSVTQDRGVVPQSESGKRNVSGDLSKYLRVVPNDLVYNTMRMWQGASARSRSEGIVSPAYTVMEVTGLASSDFMAALLRHPMLVARFRSLSQGLVDDTLTLRFDELAKIDVALPSLGEQRKIAASLSCVDEAVESTRATIDQLSVLRKAVMVELLSNGLPGRHTQFKQVEFGNIPSRWTTKTLGALVQRNTTITYGVVQPGPEDPSGIPFVRSGDVASGQLDRSILRTISRGVSAQYERTVIRGGELLIALVGQPGAVLVAPDHLAGANIARQVGMVRLREEIDSEYVRVFLASDQGRRSLLREVLGSVQQVINIRDLERVSIPIPDYDEQCEISAVVQTLERRIDVELERLESLAKFRSALASALLTGELRVTPDEAAP